MKRLNVIVKSVDTEESTVEDIANLLIPREYELDVLKLIAQICSKMAEVK